MMLARCPACQTTFRARPEHLAARAGRVRCGHCYTPFNALENLIDSPPAGEMIEPKPTPSGLSAPVFPDSPPTVLPTEAVVREPMTPSSSNAIDDAHDLDERLALALSPTTEIDHHQGKDEPIPAHEEGLGFDQAFTERPDLPSDDSIRDGHSVARASAERSPDTGDVLRWSPIRNPGDNQPVSLSDAVWPTLAAQPPEPATIQPGAFPAKERDTAAPPADNATNGSSWHVAPPPEPAADAHTAITTDPDDRPWRQVTKARYEPAFAPRTGTTIDTSDEYNPDFTRYAKGESRGRAWIWALMVGVLLGSLAVQSAYVFRVELARQWPQLRPVFVDICDRLGCDMPLPRNAQAIHVTASNLEMDPNAPTSFILHARLRNGAGYLQAHPHLELTLTDARDRPVARRVLEPREWLSSEAVEAGFDARTEIEVRLPFGAPELTNATGYRLYAFYP